MTPKPNSISQAQGVFSNCGPGIDTYELRYHCKGPACTGISGFQNQNVQCHADRDGMTCSNSVVCPEGISSYYSNFTFAQNEADPWSPNSANEPDAWISQQQRISLPSCAKFSLISDGTTGGTRMSDEGTVDKDVCRKVQETPNGLLGGESAKKPTPNVRTQAVVTSKPKVAQSSNGSRSASSGMMTFTLLLAFLILLPRAHALSDHIRREHTHQRAAGRIRDVSNKVELFAQNLNIQLAQKANAQSLNGEVFAHNLVAGIVSSVCEGYFSGADDTDFAPTIVEDCVKSIYSVDRLERPGDQFFAVFGASLLCNYVVSEAYPVAREFVPSGCEGLQGFSRSKTPTSSKTDTYAVMSGVGQNSLLSVGGVFREQAFMTSDDVFQAATSEAKSSALPSSTIRAASIQVASATIRDQSVSSRSAPMATQNPANGTPTRERSLGTIPVETKTVSSPPFPVTESPISGPTVPSDQRPSDTSIPSFVHAHELFEATLSSKPGRLTDMLSPSPISQTTSMAALSSQLTTKLSSNAWTQSLSLSDEELSLMFTSSSQFLLTSRLSTASSPRILLSSSAFVFISATSSPTSTVPAVDITSSRVLWSFPAAESTMNSFSRSFESILENPQFTASLQSKRVESEISRGLSPTSSVEPTVGASSTTDGRTSEAFNTAPGNLTTRSTVLGISLATKLSSSENPSLSSNAGTQTSSAIASRTLPLSTIASTSTFAMLNEFSLLETSSSRAQHSTSHGASSLQTSSTSTYLSLLVAVPTPGACSVTVPDPCGESCVNHSVDTLNCGSCGTRCPQSWQCVSGTCGIRSTHTTSTPTSGTTSATKAVEWTVMVLTAQTSPSQPSPSTPKTGAERVGGFIAKGFDGLW